MRHRSLLFVTREGCRPPAPVRELARLNDLVLHRVCDEGEILPAISRAYPAAVVIDTSISIASAFDLCQTLKDEAFTAVVPVIVFVDRMEDGVAIRALEAGADEVITPTLPEREQVLRLRMALDRADRDVGVHPTTRLPGTVQIERDITERLQSGLPFAVCYADIDHFKEFNDRYGYNQGDRVILIASRILRDIVRAHAPTGFVGHIGGDDFIFNVPRDRLEACCADVLEAFDLLMPWQYSEEDRDHGYYYGNDRRGNLYRVPLMTLSIGVVTNANRSFSHTGEVSLLATEMKRLAKAQAGSVFLVDRRSGKARHEQVQPSDTPRESG